MLYHYTLKKTRQNKEKMNELIRRNLLVRCENRIRVNDEYLFILDYILSSR